MKFAFGVKGLILSNQLITDGHRPQSAIFFAWIMQFGTHCSSI